MEFVQGSTVPFEEDKDYEFKMHLDLCEDDLPAWLQTGACCGKRTRRAISKTINAFLNAGKGGTILLGIADDGEIKGFSLSLQQKDHIYVAIEDLMSRYLPPVPSHLYKLNYIPVMDGNQKIVSNWNPPHPTNCSASRAHLVRSNKRCWCFNNATLATYKGKGFSRYVAELTLSPTLPICKPHLPPLKPLFCDEEGDCYIRKCASVWQISYSEVIQMTREEVNHYLRGKVMQRNVTWNTDYHMLFIDNPVGTGFSFTDSSKKGLSKNEDEVADNLYSALIQFFTIFTDYQKCDFYIAGVSYAGKYIPAIGHKIDQENPKAKLKINLVGIALGDALIDPEKMYFEFGEMFYEIGMATRKEADFINYQTNRTIDFIQQKQYLQAFLVFDELLNGNIYPYPPYIFNITGTGNFYNFLLPKPPPTNFLPFLNKDDTRKAIHVGKTELNHGEDVAMALIEDIMQSMAPNFTVLLEKYKVLVYNGQLDIIVGVTRTEGFLNQLKWSGQQGFVKAKKQIWKLNDVLAGYIRKYGNLQQVVVLNAGHHVPYDRPERAYAMMKKFIEDQ